VCAGSTGALGNTLSGGTWTSSNSLAATMASTGVLTGVAAGTANITYRMPSGCFSSRTETVALTPSVKTVLGGGSFCAGGAGVDISLSGSSTGVSYQLYLAGSASGTGVTGTGAAIDFGHQTSPGSYTVVATNTTSFCAANMAGSATVVVTPQPSAITGTTIACQGATATLSDTTAGGNWTSSNLSVATVGVASGIVTGISSGTVLLSYTLTSTGCSTTIPFVVNPLPGAITGVAGVCQGQTTTLTDGGGGTFTSSTPSVATIGAASGLVSGIASGTSVITYRLSTGCSITNVINVYALPTTYAVSGGGGYCSGTAGVHIGLVYSGIGVKYQLYNSGTAVDTGILGSNSGLSFGLQTAPGTYTVVATNIYTGCSSSMTGTASVSVSPPPTVHNVFGGGSYCSGGAGVPVSIDASDVGVDYQLYNGSTSVGAIVVGTGSSFSFGNFTIAGTYSVLATNATSGCAGPMAGSASITINTPPYIYSVSGGGNFCTGGTGAAIVLSGSDPSVSYQLNNSTAGSLGSTYGTGGPMNFGLQTTPGIYTVMATNGAGCTALMSGSATILVNPVPVANNVTGTGNYCTGGPGVHVGLDFASTGIYYVLMYYGSPIDTIAGTGSGLDFGFEPAGLYTVMGYNATTGCSNSMTGGAIVAISPLPNDYGVSGGGSFCTGSAGLDISLSGSDGGVNYQLYKGSTPIGVPLAGTGLGTLDFGTFTAPGVYTVVAGSAGTTCTGTMSGSATISVNTLPVAHLVAGGGNYCAGAAGAPVTLTGSSTGVTYVLYYGGVATGDSVSGTGGAISFGPQTSAGLYTVVATNPATTCTSNMTGSVIVNITPLPDVHNVTGGGNYCAGGTGIHIGLDGSTAGINYRLVNGSGVPVGGTIPGSGGTIDFGLQTGLGTYTAVATNPLTSCTSAMGSTATVGTNPLPVPYTVGGSGDYCRGTAGSDIVLLGGSSQPGVSYQLYKGSVPVGPAVLGTGGSVNFGSQTAGVYTVIGTNSGTSCSQLMPGTVGLHAVSPMVFTVTGGGNYCAGDTGVHVMLTSSSLGVDYQLYDGAVMVATTLSGTGSAIDFGAQTAAGSYMVVATTTAGTIGCVDTMAGSPAITINPGPPASIVSGGGTICGTSAGVPITLATSTGGVSYQLYIGSVAVGTPVMGAPSGTGITFGLHADAGTYTVMATDLVSFCGSTMLDSAVINVNPAPNAYPVTITASGNYCAIDTGVHIGVSNSDVGISYQLYRSATPVGGVITGTGAAIDMGLQTVAGTYSVVGAASSTCVNNMTGTVAVNIIPLPNVYSVIGGGNYCPGGEGVHIGLSGSTVGVYYQLYDGPYSATTLYGTGYPLDFGLQIASGSYTVIANNTVTTCPNNMFGSAAVLLDTVLTPSVTLRAYPGNDVSVWSVDSIKAVVTNGGSNLSYKWYVNTHLIPGATTSVFGSYALFNNDEVSCTVTSNQTCGSTSAAASLVLNLHNAATAVNSLNSGSNNITLVPNPNRGLFTVKGTLANANADEEVTLEVTNMLGQVVYSGKALTQGGVINQQIQLSGSLANGMYLLNLRSASGNTVFHFVVEQ